MAGTVSSSGKSFLYRISVDLIISSIYSFTLYQDSYPGEDRLVIYKYRTDHDDKQMNSA